MLRTGARHPLVVGDRLDTDIEAAWRVDADSLLVLTGVTGPAEAVLAPPHQRPAYVADDLFGLLEPQPAVSSEGGTFGAAAGRRAGRATASWSCPAGEPGSTACVPCAPPPGPATASPPHIKQALQTLGESAYQGRGAYGAADRSAGRTSLPII